MDKMRLIPSTRFLIVIMAQCAVILVTVQFSVMTFAMTCMVNSTAVMVRPVNATPDCPAQEPGEPDVVDYGGKFIWDRSMQGFILSAVSWGAAIGNIPVGLLLNQYGIKSIVSISVSLCIILTFLTPVFAEWGEYWLIVCRFAFGVAYCFTWPFIVTVCIQWTPLDELGFLMAIGACGFQIGALLSMLTSGLMCASIGWQYIFYMWGGVGLIWLLLWLAIYDTPVKHRMISNTERSFILAHRLQHEPGSILKIPLRPVLTSKPLWAIIAHQIGSWYLTTFNEMFLPTYLKGVLRISPYHNGIYTAGIWAVQIVARLFCGWLSDWLLAKGVNKTKSMKVFSLFSGILPAIFVTAIGFTKCDTRNVAVALVFLENFFYSFIIASYVRSMSLIAPNFTNHIVSIATSVGYLTAVIQSNVIGRLTTTESTDEWRVVFGITGIVCAVGCILFMMFASGEEQEWNNLRPHGADSNHTDAHFLQEEDEFVESAIN